MAVEKIMCTKCGRTRATKEFFKIREGECDDICKDCLTLFIDNKDPSTFLWILEKYDVPYIEHTWIELYNQEYEKNPGKMGPKSVIGKYLRSMKMAQYRDLHYSDSDRLNFEYQAEQDKMANIAAAKAEHADLKQKLENGEISEAEYNTLTCDSADIYKVAFAEDVINEDVISASLTEVDRKYLAAKWGIYYKPSEWLTMEELYSKYAAEYELNADREDILKKICKTSLKMDQALDQSDTNGYKQLATTYDQLRKSGKFTEAQNKEEITREIDSIGELVAFVEREGGIIPEFENNEEYPEDKMDFIIKDLQNYINNLVKNELGLSDLIESYIEKADKQEVMSVEDIVRQGFDKDDDLTLEEVQEFEEFQASEVEQEAKKLLEQFEGVG